MPEDRPAAFSRVLAAPLALFRLAGILSGVSLLALFLGCMSLSIGDRNNDADVLDQSGKVCLKRGEVQDVYYPIPYASPPNLEVDWMDADACEILEQRADHFRIVMKAGTSPFGVKWKARGVKAPVVVPAAASPCPPPTEAPPPAALPAEPAPVAKPPL
jgi:hypothetical protein